MKYLYREHFFQYFFFLALQCFECFFTLTLTPAATTLQHAEKLNNVILKKMFKTC